MRGVSSYYSLIVLDWIDLEGFRRQRRDIGSVVVVFGYFADGIVTDLIELRPLIARGVSH
jgi:hypothetical protein